MHTICSSITQSIFFQRLIILTILLAGIVVGAQTYEGFANRHAFSLNVLDKLILGIFTLEIIIKILAEGNKPLHYFRNSWNVFDFCIVAACLLEPLLPSGGAFLPVLRLARILRVLRLVTAIPKLQILVSCLLKSLPSMFYVSILLFSYSMFMEPLPFSFMGKMTPFISEICRHPFFHCFGWLLLRTGRM